MYSTRPSASYIVIATTAILLTCAFNVTGQVKTETNTTSGPASNKISVERGEVVHVSGNDLVVKMEDGSLRNFDNVPESARVTVEGHQLSIHELKPGMKLEKTTTITTTPHIVTTTKRVTGKVWQVTPPKSVILTLEDGTNETFSIPQGQKFTIDGQETDAWGLKKGMTVTATKITEEPMSVVEHKQQVTGTMPPPPVAPATDLPILVAVVTPHPTLAQATPPPSPGTPETLPKTGSAFPLLALIGAIALLCSLILRTLRKALT